MTTQIFISHITEEAGVAARLKLRVTEDFPDQVKIFLSSDTESIAAGEEWLSSVSAAIRNSSIFIVLCSPVAITRPWVNFEAGAAWMQDIPLIPACFAGLRPRDLPMPLSTRQGLELNDAQGWRRLYASIAQVLHCQPPAKDYAALAVDLMTPPAGTPVGTGAAGASADKAIKLRIDEALSHPRYKWRSLDKVAASAAIPVNKATELLRADDRVRFSRGKSGNAIVGLRSRVD
jgi:TIR domain